MTTGRPQPPRRVAAAKASKDRATSPTAVVSQRAIVLFLLRFLLGCFLSYLAVTWRPELETWAIRGTLASLSFLLRLCGVANGVDGHIIRTAGVALEIVVECTPLMPTLVLSSAIVAFPAPARNKVLGLSAGVACLWIFNLVRIGGLIAVLAWMPTAFEFTHMFLWQAATLAVVFLIFLQWLRYQDRFPGARAVGGGA